MIAYETLLDAARLHFRHVGNSPSFTREARNVAKGLERETEEMLAARNATNAAPAWEGEPETLRAA